MILLKTHYLFEVELKIFFSYWGFKVHRVSKLAIDNVTKLYHTLMFYEEPFRQENVI